MGLGVASRDHSSWLNIGSMELNGQQKPVLGQGQDHASGGGGPVMDIVSVSPPGERATTCRPGFSLCAVCGQECITKGKQCLFCISSFLVTGGSCSGCNQHRLLEGI